jgi:chloramphenicol-sensitive protein RarD
MLIAGLIWGLLPIYWKWLSGVAPVEVVAHRIIWSLLTLLLITACTGTWQNPGKRKLGWLLLSACLIGANWFIYIYAVQQGRVLECSLGYFIMPLVSVLLGLLILKERISRRKQFAIALVTLAVCLLVIHYGRIPWIALGLALTFSFYSLVRKQLPLGAWNGTLYETAVLTPVAVAILCMLANDHRLAFASHGTYIKGLLITTGLVTTVPILLSISASKRLTLTTLGLLQYLAPSIQFLLAVSVFHEPFDAVNGIAFAIIWLALAIYSGNYARRVAESRNADAARSTFAQGASSDDRRNTSQKTRGFRPTLIGATINVGCARHARTLRVPSSTDR